MQNRLLLCALIAGAALFSTQSHAATFTWDASGTGPTSPTDGAGTWSTTNSNWSNGSSDAGWSNSDNTDIAVFGNGGTAGAITVSGGVNVGGITFNPVTSGSYAIGSSTITLAGGGAITTNAAAATISSVLAGSVGLTTSGTGTLNLGGVETFTGATTVNGGSKVSLNGSASLGSGNYAGNITDNGSLSFNTSASGTLSGVISGTGALTTTFTTNGGGTLTLTGSNTFSGQTTILAGQLVLSSANGSAIPGNITLGSSFSNPNIVTTQPNQFGPGAVISFASNTNASRVELEGNNQTIGGLVTITSPSYIQNGQIGYTGSSEPSATLTIALASGSNYSFVGTLRDTDFGVNASTQLNLAISGSGEQTLNGANQYTGSTTVSSGTLQLSNALGGGTYSSAITDNGTILVNAAQTFSGPIAGSGTLNLIGGNALTLSASNTFNGSMLVTNGVLTLSSASGSVLGGSINFGNSTGNSPTIITALPNQFVPGTVLNYTNTGGNPRFDLEGHNQTLAGFTSSNSGAVMQNGQVGYSGSSEATATLTLAPALGSTYSFTGIMRDTDNGVNANTQFSLAMSGSGQQTLVGTSVAYTGATIVNSGTLAVQTDSNFASNVTVNSGGLFTFINTAGKSSGNGSSETVNSGGIFNLVNTTPVWGSGNNVAMNSAFSGAGILEVTGTGWITFFDKTNAVAVTGGIDVLSGGLGNDGGAASQSAFANSTAPLLVASGAYVDLRGAASQFDTLSGSGTIVNSFSGTTLTIGAASGSGTFAGSIITGGGSSGAGSTNGGVISLVKNGTGTQVLTGSNGYTGSTTINAGILQIGNGGSTGSIASTSAISGSSGATLVFDLSSSATESANISGSLGVIQEANSTLTLAGANTYIGNTTVTTGTMNLAGSLSSSPIVIGTNGSSGAVFEATLSGNTNILSVTTPSGATGSTLLLNPLGTYFLNVTGTSTLNSALTVVKPNNGANWAAFAPTGITGGAGAGNDSLVFSNLGGIQMYVQANAATYNYAGNVHFLTDNGASYIIQGANFFSPTASVTLDSGATVANNSSGTNFVFDALNGAGTWNTSAATSTLTMGSAGGSGTFSGIIESIGGTTNVVKTGTGTEVFTGANTYTGTTVINSGTLQIGNGGTTGSLVGTSISGSSGAALVFDLSTSATASDAISGSLNVIQNGSATQTLNGGSGVTYTGPTTVNSGTLAIQNFAAGLGAYFASNVTVNAGAGLSLVNNTAGYSSREFFAPNVSGSGTLTISGGGDVVVYNKSNTITLTGGINILAGGLGNDGGATSGFGTTTAPLAISSGAYFDLRGGASQFGALSGAGSVVNSFTGTTLTLGAGNGSGTFSGTIQTGGNSDTGTGADGTLNLVKAGTGTQVFTGSNTYTGTTTVNGGTLIVSGSLTGTASLSATTGGTLEADGLVNNSATTTLNGGTLDGTGSVGAITAHGGTIAPGFSVADASTSTGTLTAAGTVTLSSTTNFNIRLGLSASGTDSDQLAAAGNTVNLSGSLNLTLGSGVLNLTPANVDNLYYVIVNTTHAVSGTFAGLANDATISMGGYSFEISYNGSASGIDNGGTDVVLELTAVPEPSTWAAILGGFAMLIGFRRRRARLME